MDIFEASSTGNIEALKEHIENGPNRDDIFHALLHACSYGHTNCVELLLQHSSVDIDRISRENWTLLSWATYWGRVECIKILLKAGANPDMLYYSCTPLLLAINERRHECALELAKVTTNIDQRMFEGSTALVYSLARKYYDVAEILISAGADINIRTETGHCAIHYAKNIDILKSLLALGADVNSRDFNDVTPLMMFSCSGIEGCIKELIKAGADINAFDRDGWTALMDACRCGNIEIIKILVDAGANIYQIDNIGTDCCLHACNNMKQEAFNFIKNYIIKDFEFLQLPHDIIKLIIDEYIYPKYINEQS